MATDVDPSVQRVDLLSELVAVNSVNPLQAGERSGPGGETALAELVAERAEDVGATAELDEVMDGRPNVYARLAGRPDRRVAIDVHLDTVGVEHMTVDPFDPVVWNGKLHGRGSVDTKATLAVVLPLLGELAATPIDERPTVVLVGTVGEEAGGLVGAHRFAAWCAEHGEHFDELVVAEPTLCHPVHGHKGGLGLEVVVHGMAAHSSKPHLGANAIEAAIRIVQAFVAENERITSEPATTPVGSGTLSVTEITGGVARNIIPDRCELYAGRRVAPGEDPEAIFVALSALARKAAEPHEIDVAMANGRCSPAFYEEATAALIETLAELAGTEPDTAAYASNALVYRPIADQIAVFGPGSIDQAHTADEWIEISELDRAAEVYRRWFRAG